jgi:branched-subunit amino acid ABC-type transport system permease component
MTIDIFLQHLSNALALGSLYALIAIGYTMVYGILRLINFAHGDVFMLGGYIAFYCITLFFYAMVGRLSYRFLLDRYLRHRAGTRRLQAAALFPQDFDNDKRDRGFIFDRKSRYRDFRRPPQRF